jgi:hypothetical protein
MDSFEARDAMIASGMGRGVREGHERLDELFHGRQSGDAGPRTNMEA